MTMVDHLAKRLFSAIRSSRVSNFLRDFQFNLAFGARLRSRIVSPEEENVDRNVFMLLRWWYPGEIYYIRIWNEYKVC
jgi:hypothetical protein